MVKKYMATYYYENGKLGTLDNARKDAIRISKRNKGDMVYINEDMPGNPMAAVFPDGDKWIYEPRFGHGEYVIDTKTGKLKGRW